MTVKPITSNIDDLISPNVQKQIRTEIDEINGGEVFFVGRLNREMAVEEVEAYAYGNQRTVPALLRYAHPGDVILHNHPSGNLEPSDADITISSQAGDQGIGSYIINNGCTDVRVVVKATRPQRTHRLDIDELARMLSPGGLLAQRLEGYEFRPPQIEMLRAVAQSLNEGEIAAIEAPTGTGKSMAYLLPAIAWAIQNKERVVIATHTINLQEQLIEKDLPLLRQTLGLEFDAVLLKGRNNYLGRRKAQFVKNNPDFLTLPEHQEQLDAIEKWIQTTKDGSTADLGFKPESEVWEKVMSESDNCLRTQCPTYHNCFYYNARRRAARAQILVVNHHLLMADLALRAETDNYTAQAVLPPFHRIIIDEAHHLEEVATSYFGSRVSRGGMLYHLRRLAHPRTGAGLLHLLAAKIHDGTYGLDSEVARSWILRINQDLIHLHHEVLDAIEESTDQTAIAMEELEEAPLNRRLDIKRRITPEIAETNLWLEVVYPALMALITTARPYLEQLGILYRTLYETIEDRTPENMSPLLELKSTASKIERAMGDVAQFLQDKQGHCRWIEFRRTGGNRRPTVVFATSPLDISDIIRERVLRRLGTVVMTSATLTVERRFDFFLERIGAADPDRLGLIGSKALGPEAPTAREQTRPLVTLTLDSPFDFDEQVYTAVPINLPSPNDAGFADGLARFLSESLRISKGRAFVLFTSYSLLNAVHERVAPDLEAEGYPCLKQGKAERTVLTNSFRNDIGSILFATSSFWEGVDVPGEALSCLVLTRLPFNVPSEPLVEARVEAMRAAGVDPFLKLIVPQAVIRFRQGFGRLIRRRTDRGAVLICDRRVASARYGAMFLESLPGRQVHIAPETEILDSLKSFFAPSRRGVNPDP